MVTIEIDLKEGDKEPDQHLDEGENIERRIVPLKDLYDTLQGMSPVHTILPETNQILSAVKGG